MVTESHCMHVCVDGLRLCSCGADKTVVLLDLASKAQLICRKPNEAIRYVGQLVKVHCF